MNRKNFYKYTTILFLLKQQNIEVSKFVRDYVAWAVENEEVDLEELFINCLEFYQFN